MGSGTKTMEWNKNWMAMIPMFFPIRFNEKDRLTILNNLKNHQNDIFTIWCSRNGLSIEKKNGWLAKNIELEYNPFDSTDLVFAEITRDELEHMIQNPDCSLVIIPPYPGSDEEITYAIPLLSISETTLH